MAKNLRYIPSTPAELSPGWITAAMRQAGAMPVDRLVVGLDVEPLKGGGIGFAGETVRVRLSYDEPFEDQRETVVAKFATSELINRGMLEAFDAYGREICFYQELSHKVPVRVPEHMGSDCDPGRGDRIIAVGSQLVDQMGSRAHLALTKDITRFLRPTSRRYALLIEDIPDGEVYGLLHPPSRDQLAATLEQLATLHASFWGDQSLADSSALRPVLTLMPNAFVSVFRHRARPVAAQRWADWLTTDQVSRFDEIADRFCDDIELINRSVTLCHGDPRSDNLLFMQDGEVVLLDWSLAAFAHPGYDVAYLLSSSIEPEDAATVGVELIGHYRDALAGLGHQLDAHELDEVIDASCRAILLQEINGLTVLEGDYGVDNEHGDAVKLADIRGPRLLGLLNRCA
ncbi:MAG: phosphotransferase [Acidobacteria bacterium]|nr:phosphotransferase [Acidobacteriota bacterium]